jgi:hypothetical protein
MKKKIFTLLAFNFLVFMTIHGQNRLLGGDVQESNYYEFGMNMTGLVNQLIPFKQLTNKTGPYSATFKRVNGRNAFRMGIGMHIITESNFGGRNNDITNFNLRIGFERQHLVNKRFTFYQTFDFMVVGGDFNSPINDFSDSDNAGVGIGLGLGVEYYIFDNFSLSTEGIGFVGVVGGTSSIFTATVIPPVSIFLNYKF